jgi:hypothetical protein
MHHPPVHGRQASYNLTALLSPAPFAALPTPLIRSRGVSCGSTPCKSFDFSYLHGLDNIRKMVYCHFRSTFAKVPAGYPPVDDAALG